MISYIIDLYVQVKVNFATRIFLNLQSQMKVNYSLLITLNVYHFQNDLMLYYLK